MPFLWAEMKAWELRAKAERNASVILPCASMEQHGPHLPVNVDAMLVTEVAKRARESGAALYQLPFPHCVTVARDCRCHSSASLLQPPPVARAARSLIQAAAIMEAKGAEIVVAPTLEVGLAEHHMPFGGTLTFDVVRAGQASISAHCCSLDVCPPPTPLPFPSQRRRK